MTKQALQKKPAVEQRALYRTPRVNILETESTFVIEAEMPGVANDAIDIHVEKDSLTLTGRRMQQEGTRLAGRGCDGYQRVFTLGDSIDHERVEASAKNGILTVTLHKVAAKVPRKIEVKVG